MFAQGQLLGMQSDLLMRLKTEINAWDKVAERHPYSVYRTNERNSLFAPARSEDPFTTNFGEGLPFRTYDRNLRARTAQTMNRTVEQPYPQGYSGHVSKIRHVVGQTYGQQVREAINSVTPSVQIATVKPVETPSDWNSIPCKDRLVSTQQLSYMPPDDVMVQSRAKVDNSRSVRIPQNPESRYASSALLSFPPPPASCYATPGWSERPTSNIGQYDAYNHVQSCKIHVAELPRRLAGGRPSGGTITQHSAAPSLDAASTTATSA